MRRGLVLLAAALLVFGALAAPAAAIPVADLTKLADYFPANSALYLAARTDDDFISSIDGLLSNVASVLPPEAGPVPMISDMLDQSAQQFDPQGDFQSVFRSWLGDVVAIGISDASTVGGSRPSAIGVLAITDKAAAEAYLNTTGILSQYAKEEKDGYTLFSPKSRNVDEPYIILRDDVLIINLRAGGIENGGLQDTPLSSSDKFTGTMAKLPLTDYNVVAYNDFVQFLDAMMQGGMGMGMRDMGQIPTIFTDMMHAFGPQAYGGTIVDGRSLTFDAAVTIDDASVMQAMGMPMTIGHAPVDPAFAHHIPNGTPLVAHGTNIGESFLQTVAAYKNMIDQMTTGGMLSQRDAEQARAAFYALEVGIRGLTGLEPEQVFGWMTGDAAFYMGLSARMSDARGLMDVMAGLPVDFAVTIAATDPAAASAVVEGLANGLKDFPAEGVTITREEIAGANALVVTIQTKDMPFPVELVMAANDQVFSLGTRRYVTFALNPVGNGLDSDPAFIEAGGYGLANPEQMLYFAGAGLQPLAHMLSGEGNPRDMRQGGQMLGAFLNLVSSASVTVSSMEDGSGAVERFVWTLPAQ